MVPKVLEYYDYHSDIQPKLCEYMGIEEKDFRDYHRLVGGEYKDMWHVLLEVWEWSFKGNDSFFKIYSDVEQVDDMEEWETFLKRNPDYTWAEPLFKALNRLHIEYGSQLTIWISW